MNEHSYYEPIAAAVAAENGIVKDLMRSQSHCHSRSAVSDVNPFLSYNLLNPVWSTTPLTLFWIFNG